MVWASREVDKETRQAIRDYQESTESKSHERKPQKSRSLDLMPHEDVAHTEEVRGARLDNDRVQDENAPRRRLMRWTLWVVSIQIGLSDVPIVAYAIVEYAVFHQQVSDKVVVSWITVTVVQTIGILAIIARGLFNRHGRHKTD